MIESPGYRPGCLDRQAGLTGASWTEDGGQAVLWLFNQQSLQVLQLFLPPDKGRRLGGKVVPRWPFFRLRRKLFGAYGLVELPGLFFGRQPQLLLQRAGACLVLAQCLRLQRILAERCLERVLER